MRPSTTLHLILCAGTVTSGCYDYQPTNDPIGGACLPSGGQTCGAGYIGCSDGCCPADSPFHCGSKCYADEDSAAAACAPYDCYTCGGGGGGNCQAKAHTCNGDWPYYCSGIITCQGEPSGSNCTYCFPSCVVVENCQNGLCQPC